MCRDLPPPETTLSWRCLGAGQIGCHWCRLSGLLAAASVSREDCLDGPAPAVLMEGDRGIVDRCKLGRHQHRVESVGDHEAEDVGDDGPGMGAADVDGDGVV